MDPKARRWALGAILCLAALGAVIALLPRSPREAGGDPPAELDAGARSPAGTDADGASPDASPAPAADAGADWPDEPARAPELAEARARHDPPAGAGALRGTVLSWGTGAPIEGAELTFARGESTLVARSGEGGAFELRAREPGGYVLALALADGFLPHAPAWGHGELRFEAARGVLVEGAILYLVPRVEYVAVVTAVGRPVRGATVRIFGAEAGDRALAPLESMHSTDARGEARFAAPGGAVIEASHPTHGRARARLDEAAEVARRIPLALAEPDARFGGELTIAGRVADGAGAPIAGARIVAQHLARRGSVESGLHPPLDATSGAGGTFLIEGADRGEYALTARAEGYAAGEIARVAAGAREVVIELAGEQSILVRALDESAGRAIVAFTATVEVARGALERATVAVASAYASEGWVRVGGLSEGDYELTVEAPGYAPSGVHRVRAGGDEARVDVPLSRGGRLLGRVVSDAGGAALAGARVTLEGVRGEGGGPMPRAVSALTDASGAFSLSGIAEGARSIVVWAEGHHGRLRTGLAVAAGAVLDVGTIELAAVAEGERPQLEMAGIGAVLAAEGDAMVVGRVIDGGGAAEAGLREGDGILAVDGAPVGGLGFAGTIDRIRGPEGTWVMLRVRRGQTVSDVRVPRRRLRA